MTNRTAMFDAIRQFAPDKRFDKPAIALVDQLADLFALPRLATDYAWLPIALGLIKQFEGCRLQAYPDPATGGDPWTIGWGATGAGIKRGVTWTQDEADARLAKDVERFADGVSKALGDARTTDAQKAAMISMAYNVGLAAFAGSTLLRKHKAGDYSGAADEFQKWNKAGGKIMTGLTRRRQAEARTYRGQA